MLEDPLQHSRVAASIHEIRRLRTTSCLRRFVFGRVHVIGLAIFSIFECAVHTIKATCKFTAVLLRIPLALVWRNAKPIKTCSEAAIHLFCASKLAIAVLSASTLGLMQPELAVSIYQTIGLVKEDRQDWHLSPWCLAVAGVAGIMVTVNTGRGLYSLALPIIRSCAIFKQLSPYYRSACVVSCFGIWMIHCFCQIDPKKDSKPNVRPSPFPNSNIPLRPASTSSQKTTPPPVVTVSLPPTLPPSTPPSPVIVKKATSPPPVVVVQKATSPPPVVVVQKATSPPPVVVVQKATPPPLPLPLPPPQPKIPLGIDTVLDRDDIFTSFGSYQALPKKPLDLRPIQAFNATRISQDAYQQVARVDASAQAHDMIEFGPKYANCMQMHTLHTQRPIAGLSYPQPMGIPSSTILRLLHTYAPQVFDSWKELAETYQAHFRATGPAVFLEQLQTKHKIAEICASVKKALDPHQTHLDETMMPDQLKEMLAVVKQSQGYLMVRSSAGSEDTTVCVNAGGNVSVEYVNATFPDVMRAVGEVVASYFDIPSLKNRLDAGEQNPFQADKLKLGLFIQELIGEPILENMHQENAPEDIPISLVCLSNEPLFVDDDWTLTVLSATFGHGKSVVGTEGINCDNYYIFYSRAKPGYYCIIADIKEKYERLAPVRQPNGKVVLTRVKNPKQWIKEPVLTDEQVAAIAMHARGTQQFFGDQATDIEGVFKRQKDSLPETLHIVQARPKRSPKPDAYYFDASSLPKDQRHAMESMLQAIPLVPGRCNVLEITKGNQLLMTDTLEQAVRCYRAAEHLASVVTMPSPPLSHPVITFGFLGVPGVFTPNGEAVNKLKGRVNQEHSILLCTQTATLYLWNKTIANPRNFIKQGFGKHPARLNPSPLSRSLHLAAPPPTDPEIEQGLLSLRSAIASNNREEACQALHVLQSHPCVTALNQEAERHVEILNAAKNPPRKAHKLMRALLKYQADVQGAFAEMEAVLNSKTGRMRCLFNLALLESLLVERIEEPGAVGRCCLMHVPLITEGISALLDYQQRLPKDCPAQFTNLLLDAKRVPTSDPAVFNDWRDYLLTLEIQAARGEILPAQIKQFKDIIKFLRKIDLLPFWFLFFFKPGPELFHTLLQQFATEGRLLATLHRHEREIAHLHGRMDQFTHKETFSFAWEKLQKRVKIFCNKTLLELIQSSSPLTKNIAYQVTLHLVTLLDTAIKTMKISNEWSDREKVVQFKTMLWPYFTLMATWSEMIPEKNFYHDLDLDLTRNRYLRELQKILSESSDSISTLAPSPIFNVMAALLAAKTNFYSQLPETLEDIFMLLHQNMLSFLSMLHLQSLPSADSAYLPLALKEIIPILNKECYQSPISLTVTENCIVDRRHRILHNHCAFITLVYDKQHSQTRLELQIVGRAARQPWENLQKFIEHFQCVEVGQNGTTFVCNVDVQNIRMVALEATSVLSRTFL